MSKIIMDEKQNNNRSKIPACNIELENKTCGLDSTIELIKYKLKYPVDGTIYDSSHIVFINSIWNYFETLFAHLIGQIQFILRSNDIDYWEIPFSLRYSISESIVIEAHILRAVVGVIWGDSGYTPFFADKKDLLVYYLERLEMVSGMGSILYSTNQIILNWPLDNIPNLGKSEKARRQCYTTDEIPDFEEVLYYGREKAENASKTMKELVADELYSLSRYLSSSLDCDYLLAKNSNSFIEHIASIRKSWDYKMAKKEITERRKIIYKDLRSDFILNHNSISDVQEHELQHKALQQAICEKWPDTYNSYEKNYHHIENERDSLVEMDGISEWMHNFMRNKYEGEHRDDDGNLTYVGVDKNGRTKIVGKSGWERWIELVTIAALFEEEELEQAAPQEASDCSNNISKPEKGIRREPPQKCIDAINNLLKAEYTINSSVFNSRVQLQKAVGEIDLGANAQIGVLLAICKEVGVVKSNTGNTDFVRILIGLGFIGYEDDEQIRRIAHGFSQKIKKLPSRHTQWSGDDKTLGDKLYDTLRQG